MDLPHNIETSDIINGPTSLINSVIKRDQINLQMYIPDDLPEIKCRSQQIQQVIMSLLTNARDALNSKYFGYDQNKIITVTCRQYSKSNRRWVQIIVEDHGNGIPKEIQQNIFNPFYTTKRRDKRSGLGLSISYGIVKDHHGSLSFETVSGQYTKFLLDLPVDNGWFHDVNA